MYQYLIWKLTVFIVIQDNSNLAKNQEKRKKRWKQFLEQNTERLIAVENLAKGKELEYRQLYQELEEKLKIN